MGKWYLLVTVVTLLLSYRVYKKAGAWLALFVTYIMLSPVAVSLIRMGPYSNARNSILFEPLKAWVYLVCLVLIFLYVNPRLLSGVIKWLVPINIVYSAVCIYIEGYTPGNQMVVGFDGNRSVNATLMAMMLPFCMNWFTILGTMAIILYCKVSMGMFAALSAIVAFYFAKCRKIEDKAMYLVTLLLFGIVGAGLLYSYYGPDLFVASGRMATWKLSFALLQNESREMFGFGIGSFSHILPSAKILWPKLTPESVVMLWAHSDIVQYIFEGGWYGVLIAIPLFVQILYKSWKVPMFLSFYAAYLSSCVGNFPSHLASSSLLCIVMISLMYHREGFDEKN